MSINLPVLVCLVAVGNTELACISASIQCTSVHNATIGAMGIGIGNRTDKIECNVGTLVCLPSSEQTDRNMISRYDNEHEMLLLSFLGSTSIAR